MSPTHASSAPTACKDPASAQLKASVTVAGISVSGDKTWSWGAPPVIATQVGDKLYLNTGDRWTYREKNLNNPLYDDIKNEKTIIFVRSTDEADDITAKINTKLHNENIAFSYHHKSE